MIKIDLVQKDCNTSGTITGGNMRIEANTNKSLLWSFYNIVII